MGHLLRGYFRRNSDLLNLSVIALSASAAVVRIFLGYGYDNDTYRLLSTIQHIVSEGVYVASRNQGSLVAEMILGGAAALGGSLASNATAFAASALALGYTYRLANLLDRRAGLICVSLCISNGYYIVASSTSMDYIFAQCFLVAGAYYYARGARTAAAICFAGATGARLAFLLFSLAFALAWTASAGGRVREIVREFGFFALSTFLISGLFYVPVWISNGLALSWLGAAPPDFQGFAGLVVRFVYKSAYLFGPVGLVLAVFVAVFSLAKRAEESRLIAQRAAVVSAAVIVCVLLVFLRIPVEPSYLLPALPFIGIFLVALDLKAVVGCLVAGNLFAAAVNVEVLDIRRKHADPCAPIIATGAQVEFSLKPGILLAEFANIEKQDVCFKDELMLFPYENHRDRLLLRPAR